MTPHWKRLGLITGLVGLLLASGCAKLQSRDEMNKGVQAYKATHYADSAAHFKRALELDPTNQNARLYLATSYMTQWVPGADSPDNRRNLEAARKGFEDVLSKDPKDKTALAAMAFMAYSNAVSGPQEQKNQALDEAQKWNERRLEVNPSEAEAYYYLGVISWAKAYNPIQAERVALKMRSDSPGPIPNGKVREDLKAKFGKLVDQGIADLHKALDLDKENEDAMTYLNLLLRKKADLEDDKDAAKADIAQAEDWSNKSLEIKKVKATRTPKKENG